MSWPVLSCLIEIVLSPPDRRDDNTEDGKCNKEIGDTNEKPANWHDQGVRE